MGFVELSMRWRFLNQATLIGLVSVLGAGCSSDFSRFDAGLYTASIANKQNAANQNNAQLSNPYPGEVDSLTTASISRPTVARPPLPTSDLTASNVRTDINQYPKANQPIDLRQPAVQTTNNYNTYNTYYRDERQQVPVKIRRTVVSKPVNIDAVTTSSIRPAKPAGSNTRYTKLDKKPVIVKPIFVKPVENRAAKIFKQQPVDQSAPSGWTAIGGTQISVRNGETLHNISKRYGVPVNELRKANKITNADHVEAGQRIIIPTYVYSDTAPISAPDNNPKTRASRSTTGMIGEVDVDKIITPTKSPKSYSQGLAAINLPKRKSTALKQGTRRYQVVGGDTLSLIASNNNVRLSELMAANDLENTNIKIGQKLIIPGQSVTSLRKNKVSSEDQPVEIVTENGKDEIVTGSLPKAYKKPKKSRLSDNIAAKELDEEAPARTGIETFRWPATGRLMSKFGERRRGQLNEGIDISVPEGTSVKAAENGVVIYSDSELQEYGNLLLVRHDGGWVSAYAHNKTLRVKRGDKVRRGQIIAKSGRTGNAGGPMIHFELRKHSTPVNPQRYLR